jgi:hypothetical protein
MWPLFLVLFVGVCGLLAACGDDDGKKELNPAPLLTAVSPTSATAGGASFTLTATGSNFLVTSAVHWNGAARPTTFVSATQLTATIPASDVATAGTAQVTVVNPAPGGGTSSAIAFTIQSPPPPTTGTAEGLWRGTTNTGRSITGLVRGNGEYWLIYSAAGNSAVLAGALQGNGTSQSGRFTSSNGIDFNFEGAGNRPVTIDATYVEKTSFDGAVKYTGRSSEQRFAAAYDIEYGLQARIGPWLITTFKGTGYVGLIEYTEVTVDASGALTGVSASGCRFSGTLTPSTDGNYYDVKATFQGGACVSGTSTVTGVAFFEFYPRRLTSATLNTTRTNGFVFIGQAPW